MVYSIIFTGSHGVMCRDMNTLTKTKEISNLYDTGIVKMVFSFLSSIAHRNKEISFVPIILQEQMGEF